MILLIACTSCKASNSYLISSYLKELAHQSGISFAQEIDTVFAELLKWEVVEDKDKNKLSEELTYAYLVKTINSLVKDNNNEWIINKKDNDLISENEAKIVINKAVALINNPSIENEFFIEEKDINHLDRYSYSNNQLKTDIELEIGDVIYLEDDKIYKKIVDKKDETYILYDPAIDEILEEIEIAGSDEIDFNNAEIIPYDDEEYIETEYINNNYELLASSRHTFNSNGFNVAYSFNSSGIDVRVSKSAEDKLNMFFDISLSNIKPTYKWKYKSGKIEEAFFKVNFKLTNELGVSTGKYNNYYLDFKDLDSSSFLNKVKSMIKTSDDEIECTIPICQIKTPIPNVPIANFNIDVVAKVYTSGRVEIVLYDNGVIGFEINEGNFRIVHDVNKDSDFIIGGSARAVAGLNFNLEASQIRLMDIEFDAGARAAVTSTLHLYDEQGNKTEENSDIPYSILQEISKENKDVRVCGDVSLNWVFDVQLNTSKTIPYKYGLTYKRTILDSDNQIFNNLTHIENWQFVKKCTRKSRTIISSETTNLNSNKIVLGKYSAVVIKGEKYEIPIVSLPNGYTASDLVYYSNNSSLVTVADGTIEAHDIGAVKIDIKTKDDKYKAYINILVSTG